MFVIYFESTKIINHFDESKTSSTKLFLDILHQIKHQKLTIQPVLYWKNEQEFLNTIYKHTKPIIAAGGLVYNHKKELLLIYRNNHWDLPKGKQEPNEGCIENAIREIEEETHVTKLAYIKDIEITHHLYFIDNICILKKTYWYVFQSLHTEILKPQKEEGIEQVKWIPIKELPLYTHKMFLLIRELLEKYLKMDS
ncbi:MAG: NUDIX hydrolase [Chitinophagaceae bacterium]